MIHALFLLTSSSRQTANDAHVLVRARVGLAAADEAEEETLALDRGLLEVTCANRSVSASVWVCVLETTRRMFSKPSINHGRTLGHELDPVDAGLDRRLRFQELGELGGGALFPITSND